VYTHTHSLADGQWEVLYAPHMYLLQKALMTEFGPRYILGTSKGENTIVSNVRYESPLFGNGWLNAAGTYNSVDRDTGVSTPPPPPLLPVSQPVSLLSWHTWMCVRVCVCVCVCVHLCALFNKYLNFFVLIVFVLVCVCICACVYRGVAQQSTFHRAIFYFFIVEKKLNNILFSFFPPQLPEESSPVFLILCYVGFFFLSSANQFRALLVGHQHKPAQ